MKITSEKPYRIIKSTTQGNAKLLTVSALIALIITAFSFSAYSENTSTNKGSQAVIVKGSAAMASQINDLAEEFTDRTPGVAAIVSALPISRALEDFKAGRVQVVMVARPLTSEEVKGLEENGKKITERLVGWDGVALIINKDNPVENLTIDDIKMLLSGKMTNWKEIGGADKPVKLYMEEDRDSGTIHFFRTYVMKGHSIAEDVTKRRYFDNMMRDVAKDVDGLGYAPLNKVLESKNRDRLRMISVKKTDDSTPVHPSVDHVNDRSYPLIRPLFLIYYREGVEDKLPMKFAEFCARMGLGLH